MPWVDRLWDDRFTTQIIQATRATRRGGPWAEVRKQKPSIELFIRAVIVMVPIR